MAYTVKQARLLCGKTQQEMADLMGIHRNTYQKIESDPESATIRHAKMICTITNLPIDSIFFGRNSTESRVTA
jgi:DNA-binding XRE family transcriptional regulator